MIFPPSSWAQALLILGPTSFVFLSIYRALILRKKNGQDWYVFFRFIFPLISFFFLLTVNGALDFREAKKLFYEVKFQKIIQGSFGQEFLVVSKNNEWFMVRKDEYDLLQRCPHFYIKRRKGLLGISWREHIHPNETCNLLKK
jgi:hypothetical protein